MSTFEFGEGRATAIYVETTAENGIKRIAEKVAKDISKVTGCDISVEAISEISNIKNAVFVSDFSTGKLVGELTTELPDLKELKDKWECFGFFELNIPSKNVENVLVISGSDKLGTIYGLFTISDKIGVSPLCYWADSVIPKKPVAVVEYENGAISKEPSVKYRGLFINDEWPCFGNWTMDHFGGFTAEMYDHVFELLLRLKGNYLWPAMWSSSFAWDGPGLASYELADEYGIYIGNSHHEPCLRAGEEYRQVRGKDSIYGDAWNFHTNTEGITRFWRDSLMERGGFTSLVTVGMRGEADSKILGENATLKDNIDLLKKVIVCQKQLIKEAEQKFNKKFPMMLALYKEVEPFYYGDADTEGLCDWDELSDVTMMLCEDNYGYLRTVPDEKMRKHPAGFGMYYHVDYHGGPISYEWVNSTPLTKMWEQMTQAYEYGVRDIWILNTGDLKHNEFPLSYFLNLAYDFDKWGTAAPNTSFEFTKQMMALQFGGTLSEDEIEEASEIITETIRLNGLRRPEALNASIYHPCHYEEADRMLERIASLDARTATFESLLSDEATRAWYSLTGFQTHASINLLRMHLSAAKNELLARQGRKNANLWSNVVTRTLSVDKQLKDEWAAFENGKWKGMEREAHIGFTKWNEDGCKNPLRFLVEPVDYPRMQVVRNDSETIYDKVYGPLMNIIMDDFCYGETETVSLTICNTGTGSFEYTIDLPECSWLSVDSPKGKVEGERVVTFRCDRSKLTTEVETVKGVIKSQNASVAFTASAKSNKELVNSLPKMTFITGRFGYEILAKDYAESNMQPTVLEDYGLFESGVKFFPVTKAYPKGSEPALTYRIYSEEEKEVTVAVTFAPTNPLTRDGILEYGLKVNGGEAIYENTVPKGFRSGETSDPDWCAGALNHRRVLKQKARLNKGLNDITLLMTSPGLVALKLSVYERELPVSYLGGPESIFNK